MVKPVRLFSTLVATSLVLGMIMLIPIPRYVYGCFYIQAQDVETVYVEEPGALAAIYVQPNQFVEKGTPLVLLESPDLNQQLIGLESEVRNALVELRVAQQAEIYPSLEQMTPVEAEAAVDTAIANYRKKEADYNRLRVDSPRSGFFLAAHRKPVPNSDSGLLDGWHGSPLEPRNIGCSMDRQTVVGQIVPDMKKLNAVLAIDQSEIEFIRSDQQVKLVSWQDQTKILESKTEQISPVKMKIVPRSLSSRFGGGLVTKQNADGDDEPLSTTYMVNVSVELEKDEAVVFPGSTGVARIRTGSQTVGARLWRLVCQTFQFEL